MIWDAITLIMTALLCTFPAWLKFHFVVFHFLVIRTSFAHALTVYRYTGRWVSCHTCHVQKLKRHKLAPAKFESEQSELPKEFKFWWIDRQGNGPECIFRSLLQFLVKYISLWTKWPPFRKLHLQMAFCEQETFEVCSKGLIDSKSVLV